MKSVKVNNSSLSVKDFQFDGNSIIKQDDPKPIHLKAIIYCRVSSDRQVKEGNGLETQEELCRQRCKNHSPSIEVIKVFREEGVSGNKQIRPAFEAMLSYVATENKKYTKITHFVCRDLSRISRPDLENVGQAFALEARIKALGMEIVDISGNINDATDEGLLLKNMMYSFAAYTRLDFKRKSANAKKAKMMMGYRPFGQIPIGYKRNKITKKDYVDEIDRDTAIIIKQGLELFANNPIMSIGGLYEYLKEKGLKAIKSNKNKDNKVYRTYIDKMFGLTRLYYYAGYLIYPNRGINELIEAKHEGIISLSIANKIKEKLQMGQTPSKPRTEDDYFILKQLITCTGCGRKLTGRPTTKKLASGEIKLYDFYGCQKQGCIERTNIHKIELEGTIISMIKDIELSSKLLDLFEVIFNKIWAIKSEDRSKEIHGKHTRLKQISFEKDQITNRLLNSNLPNTMVDHLSNKRSDLEGEEIVLSQQVENKTSYEIERKNILTKTKELIKSPLSFRECGDVGLRKLLLSVRFGDTLYHSKKGGLQTSDRPSLYSVLKELKQGIYQASVS